MPKKRTDSDWINGLLWVIYILLLGVLLPHTAWMFSRGENADWQGQAIAWAAATVFELVIAAMTHKLSGHISNTPRYADNWKRFKARYVNAYGAGLGLAWVVSTYANLAHAVEFGQPIKIFAAWGWPVWTYSVAFGAILPTASLLFAWVLSSVIEQDATEGESNPELDRAKVDIRRLQDELRKAEQERIEANRQANDLEERAIQAELRFNAAGDMFAALFANQKRERILFARQKWPELPGSSIAILTEASPAYVSEVLNGSDISTNGNGHPAS